MLKNNSQDKELLLRKHAAKGEFEKVQEILDGNRNSGSSRFNIDSQSSNGNTALHWACFKAIEIHKGNSADYSKTIQLLIQYGVDYLSVNKLGKKPCDLFREGDEYLNSLHAGLIKEGSCYFSLIHSILKKECQKITSPSELEGESAIATGFYSIIDGLKLFEFFPQKKHEDTFTILSLACGISNEILPLIVYFQHQNKKINYIGIDNNSAIVEDNKARYKAYENVSFICADASNPSEMSAIIPPHSINFGIMRNGDFTESNGRQHIFCQIVNQVFPKSIKPDYPILMTFQTEYELNICNEKTQLNDNFRKFRDGNFFDNGKRCFFPTQRGNDLILTYPDRYSFILNLDQEPTNQNKLSHSMQKLRM
ncbi:MAG: hypothetical protein RJA25_91 [Bacteroidota bacterium]|jgi:hypothetical protein